MTKIDKPRQKSSIERFQQDTFELQSIENLLKGATNLATPDNSHNCAEPNASDAEQTKPPESPKLPLAFTVITGITPALLTKIIGLDAAMYLLLRLRQWRAAK